MDFQGGRGRKKYAQVFLFAIYAYMFFCFFLPLQAKYEQLANELKPTPTITAQTHVRDEQSILSSERNELNSSVGCHSKY